MNTEIRQATLADSDQIFSLVEAFAASFDPTKEAFENSLRHLLADDSVLTNVSLLRGEIIAYCLAFDHYAFYADGRVTWVEEIMVKEELRGSGIGKALMSSVEAWAFSRKSKLIGLATRRAASFYEAIGYEDSAVFFRKLVDNNYLH